MKNLIKRLNKNNFLKEFQNHAISMVNIAMNQIQVPCERSSDKCVLQDTPRRHSLLMLNQLGDSTMSILKARFKAYLKFLICIHLISMLHP